MATNIKFYSEKDIQKMVKEAVAKRFFSFERLLNSLRGRLTDIEKIIEFRDKKWKENRK